MSSAFYVIVVVGAVIVVPVLFWAVDGFRAPKQGKFGDLD